MIEVTCQDRFLDSLIGERVLIKFTAATVAGKLISYDRYTLLIDESWGARERPVLVMKRSILSIQKAPA